MAAPTTRKWLGRYLDEGLSGVVDASSRPKRSSKGNLTGPALLIVELRRKCWLQARIAQQVGVSTATVSRLLARAGLSRLPDMPIHLLPAVQGSAAGSKRIHAADNLCAAQKFSTRCRYSAV